MHAWTDLSYWFGAILFCGTQWLLDKQMLSIHSYTRSLLLCLGLAFPPVSDAGCEETALGSGTTYTFAVENSWPPYADQNGMGFSRSIVQHALAAVCLNSRFEVMPYARVLREVESGSVIAGFNVTRQSSTDERFIFGQTPILKADASFFTLKAPESPLQRLAQVPDNTRVGVIIDYEYGDQYEAHRHRFIEMRLDSQEKIVQLLQLGRIDAAIMFDEVAATTLDGLGLERSTLFNNFKNHTSDIYVAFTYKHADLQGVVFPLVEALERGLKIIKDEGVYAKIFAGEIQ